jgi:hypothetical protein
MSKLKRSVGEKMTQIMKNMKVESFPIKTKLRSSMFDAWKKAAPKKLKQSIALFRPKGSILEVTGTPESIQFVADWLNDGKYLDNNPRRNKQGASSHSSSGEGLCSVCYCEVDKPYYFRACGHGGCFDCMVEFFSQESTEVPVKCFSTDCGRSKVALTDIRYLAPPTSIGNIEDKALTNFVASNRATVMQCPSVQCQQLINIQNDVQTTALASDEMKLGGEKVCYCVACKQTVRGCIIVCSFVVLPFPIPIAQMSVSINIIYEFYYFSLFSHFSLIFFSHFHSLSHT